MTWRKQNGIPMNKAARILTMTGLALVAGAAFGSTPAMAASSSSTSTTATQSTTQADRVVRYYRSSGECRRAGRVGEIFGRWDDYTCRKVWFGPYRGWYALSVDWNWHGNGNHWPHGNGQGHGNGDSHGHGNGNHWPHGDGQGHGDGDSHGHGNGHHWSHH
jgi:hypothetical protein